MSGRALRYLTHPIHSDFPLVRRKLIQFPLPMRVSLRFAPKELDAGTSYPAERVHAQLPGLHVRALRRFAAAEWSHPPCGKFFLDDRAVQIVHAVTEGNLCERQPHAHPISREMVDVIEINAADGQIAELLKRRRRFHVREDS